MIPITYANTNLFNKKWPFISQYLTEAGYTTEITPIDQWELNTDQFDPVNIIGDIRSNLFRVAIINLSTLAPGSLPDDITVAAVSDRSESFDQIFYKPCAESDSLVPMHQGQRIYVNHLRQAHQIKDLFPHIEPEVVDYAFLDLNNQELEGFMIDLDHIGSEEFEGFSQFTFHPKEFIPRAGQNVLAIICRKSDVEMVELFRKIHQAEVASCTNLERKFTQQIMKLGHKGVGAYCILDSNQYYHFYAGFYRQDLKKYIRHRYSSGTSGGMIDEMIEQMLKIV